EGPQGFQGPQGDATEAPGNSYFFSAATTQLVVPNNTAILYPDGAPESYTSLPYDPLTGEITLTTVGLYQVGFGMSVINGACRFGVSINGGIPPPYTCFGSSDGDDYFSGDVLIN